MKTAEKVVRIDAEAYDFVIDFANINDLRIGEAVSVLMKYCASKNLTVKHAHIEVTEAVNLVKEADGR